MSELRRAVLAWHLYFLVECHYVISNVLTNVIQSAKSLNGFIKSTKRYLFHLEHCLCCMINNRVFLLLWICLILLFAISPACGKINTIHTQCGSLIVDDHVAISAVHAAFQEYKFDYKLIPSSTSDTSVVSLNWVLDHLSNNAQYSATVYIQKLPTVNNITDEVGRKVLETYWKNLYEDEFTGKQVISSFGSRSLIGRNYLITGDGREVIYGQATIHSRQFTDHSYAAVYSPVPGYLLICESNEAPPQIFIGIIRALSFKP